MHPRSIVFLASLLALSPESTAADGDGQASLYSIHHLLESLESIDHLLIESEPSVTKGGCIVETPIGDVDAQIEERLERVRSALIEDLMKDTGEEE